jgi:hypothetical protein
VRFQQELVQLVTALRHWQHVAQEAAAAAATGSAAATGIAIAGSIGKDNAVLDGRMFGGSAEVSRPFPLIV